MSTLVLTFARVLQSLSVRGRPSSTTDLKALDTHRHSRKDLTQGEGQSWSVYYQEHKVISQNTYPSILQAHIIHSGFVKAP